MRRLRDYWDSRDPAERRFVRQLLATMAGGPLNVTARTWENAQKAWEIKVVQYTNEGHTYPEVSAANWLLMAATAQQEVGHFDIPDDDPDPS
ncbi:hypothetical protein MAUB_64260 (plasmid) [Mycolicibacterium aubagnense]|uniref:Uncharacterized protein n=1 Tax=Mycolicibacterium aubagnense TaxID=319707 RepID=A0ABM7INE4_9MYCO|nr:hypothetical protein [Mycolicibacterium aubagnense]BBX88225.1 hypothetical protein MAUB_64260 [Mycolicibacterium aubagnense]